MLVAKLTATTGVALFLAGAAGVAPMAVLAAGCFLFLIAALIGAVVLEERDLESVAALVSPELREPDTEPLPGPSELPSAA